jgi:hypothetical protein
MAEGQWLAINGGVGVKLKRKPTFEEWQLETESWIAVDDVTPIVIGDLLNWGEELFPERYAQVVDPMRDHYKPQTLSNYKSVMKAVPRSVRQKGLKYKHYEQVRRLKRDEQRQLLKRAAKEGWSARQLGKEKRALLGEPPNSEPFRVEVMKVVEEVRGREAVLVLEGLGLTEGELPDGPATVSIRARKEGT